jgi:PAS domain S-box-containing protein
MGEPEQTVPAGEGEVRIESEHLAAIVRSSDDAILSKDRNAIITSWNDGAERLYGYTADEVVGQSVAVIIPPERRGEEKEIVRRILAGERVDHYETERIRKDGARVAVSLTASPIHAPDGEIVGVSTQARTISATQRALADAEQRFQSAFGDAPIGMFMFRLDSGASPEVTQANAEMTRLLGYAEAEFKRVAFSELTHPADAEVELRLLRQLAAGDRASYGIEKRCRHRDGSWIWLAETVSRVQEAGAYSLALAHVIDVTDRRRAAHQLEEARLNLERSNAELDQFAYVASHDLKEPLILVSAYARMLEERHAEGLDEEGRRFLSHIREEGARMKTMVDDLLDYSRLETRAEPEVQVDLNDCVDAALRRLAPLIEETAAAVEVERPLPTVTGSASQFERLLRNLLSNAMKFHADAAPSVRVSAERNGGEWLVSVSDNGIGVQPAQAERIFEVFQRLNTQERYQGSGMGLAICKRIVERHGGRIWVAPREGGGSVFTFALRA